MSELCSVKIMLLLLNRGANQTRNSKTPIICCLPHMHTPLIFTEQVTRSQFNTLQYLCSKISSFKYATE